MDVAIYATRAFVHTRRQTIKQTGLRDQDVVVLTLKRGESVISNPKSSRVLEAHDTLLCYGKIAAMKSMIQDRPKRRKKLKPLPSTPVTEGTTIEDGSAL